MPLPIHVAGRWTEPGSNLTEELPDPATGEPIAELRHADESDVEAAVAGARAAAPAWADTPVAERVQVLFRLKTLLESEIESLASIVVSENGKTRAEAIAEVRRGVEVLDFSVGAPMLTAGRFVDQVGRGIDQQIVRFPVGVVAGVTPFNFPAMIPLWMLGPAIACGNSFVLKPSPFTPLTANRLVELWIEAGLPPGVLSVIHGGAEATNQLITHPSVDAVSFVGSAPVARHIYVTATGAGKRVQALGGAKNHMIVMEDADIAPTVEAVSSSAFGMAGQRCLAGSVVVCVGGIADVIEKELAVSAESIRIGPGSEPEVDMGPLIRGQRVEALHAAIEEGLGEGAQLLVDGRTGVPERGFFMRPTLLGRVTPEMSLWRTELFGPVLSLLRVPTLEEALRVTNRSSYGNMASIFTTSGGSAREFQRRAEAGMIGVNVGVAAPMAFLPFTGWKDSFFGDLHADGEDGMRFYTRHKVVSTRWF